MNIQILAISTLLLLTSCAEKTMWNHPAGGTQQQFATDSGQCEMQGNMISSTAGFTNSVDGQIYRIATKQRAYRQCMFGKGYVRICDRAPCKEQY